jgi:hypothetical protein
MPGRPAWRATPRGLRSLAEAANALRAVRGGRSKLAVIVGAGVDQSLAGRPVWTDLLGRLGNGLTVAGPCHESLTKSARDWPMETAEALRLTLGPERFGGALREALPPSVAAETNLSAGARASWAQASTCGSFVAGGGMVARLLGIPFCRARRGAMEIPSQLV